MCIDIILPSDVQPHFKVGQDIFLLDSRHVSYDFGGLRLHDCYLECGADSLSSCWLRSNLGSLGASSAFCLFRVSSLYHYSRGFRWLLRLYYSYLPFTRGVELCRVCAEVHMPHVHIGIDGVSVLPVNICTS